MRSRSRSPHNTHSFTKYQSHTRSKQRSCSRSRSQSCERSHRRDDDSYKSRRRILSPLRGKKLSSIPRSSSRELDKYRQERYENKGKKWEATKNDSEKWPNDMYSVENEIAKSSTLFMKPIKKTVEDQFMDSRRLQREIIGVEGVPFVWGKSPVRTEV